MHIYSHIHHLKFKRVLLFCNPNFQTGLYCLSLTFKLVLLIILFTFKQVLLSCTMERHTGVRARLLMYMSTMYHVHANKCDLFILLNMHKK